jgi:hypothetical protein
VDKKRNWLIALLVVVLIAAGGVGVLLIRNVLSSKATGGELVLTEATDPGVNSFMPPAATPPPSDTQPPPTLQPQGDGTTVATQPLPGDRDGIYGGTLDNAEFDREKIITFLSTHPAQASAFVDALDVDTTVYWSGSGPRRGREEPHATAIVTYHASPVRSLTVKVCLVCLWVSRNLNAEHPESAK